MSSPIDPSQTKQAQILSLEIQKSGFLTENTTLKKTQVFCNKIFKELTPTSDPTSKQSVEKNLILIKQAITNSKNTTSLTRKKIDKFLVFISFGIYQSKETKLNDCLKFVSNELEQIKKTSQENIKKSYQEFRSLELTETPRLFAEMTNKTKKEGVLSMMYTPAYFNSGSLFSNAFTADINRSNMFFIDKQKQDMKIGPLNMETAQTLIIDYPELSSLSLIINQKLPTSLLHLLELSNLELSSDKSPTPIFLIGNYRLDEGGSKTTYSITKKEDGSYIIKNTTSFKLMRLKYIKDFGDFPKEEWTFTLSGEIKLSQTAVKQWEEQKKQWVNSSDKPLSDETNSEQTNAFFKKHNITYAMEISKLVPIT